mgnify:FL=1
MPTISRSIIIHYSVHRTFLPRNTIVRFEIAPHLTIHFTKTQKKIYLCRCLMAHRQSASRIIFVFRLLPYERMLIRYLSRFNGKFLFLKTSSHKVLTENCVLHTLSLKKFSFIKYSHESMI